MFSLNEFTFSNKAMVIERIERQDKQLQLQKRGKHYEIIYNGVFLMASYNGGAEREMVRHALKLAGPEKKNLAILVAGLGMGFSLEEALRCRRTARIDVIEIEEKIIEWNNHIFGTLNNCAIDDRRVQLHNQDLQSFIDHSKGTKKYDILIMDIDNGPDWLARPCNSLFYTIDGLQGLKEMLVPHGILSVWAADESPSFQEKLNTIFTKTCVEKCLETTGQYSYYYVAVNS